MPMSDIITGMIANPDMKRIQSIQPSLGGHFLYIIITTKVNFRNVDIKCNNKGTEQSGGSTDRIQMIWEQRETRTDIRKYFLKVVLRESTGQDFTTWGFPGKLEVSESTTRAN